MRRVLLVIGAAIGLAACGNGTEVGTAQRLAPPPEIVGEIPSARVTTAEEDAAAASDSAASDVAADEEAMEERIFEAIPGPDGDDGLACYGELQEEADAPAVEDDDDGFASMDDVVDAWWDINGYASRAPRDRLTPRTLSDGVVLFEDERGNGQIMIYGTQSSNRWFSAGHDRCVDPLPPLGG